MLDSMSSRVKTLFALHLLLMVYSVTGILSKLAAGVDFLSWQFVALYAGVLALLGAYAIGWQQILKRMPLTSAFSNKAVTIVWGIIWGFLFFHEPLTAGKAVGAVLIVAGVVLFAHADAQDIPPRTPSEDEKDRRSAIVGADGVIIDG